VPLQQDFSTVGDQNSEPFAAAQHNFLEADIHSISNRPDSNRPFAAPRSDVLVADFPAIRCALSERQQGAGSGRRKLSLLKRLGDISCCDAARRSRR
jgi:hypothetical protein